MQMTIN